VFLSSFLHFTTLQIFALARALDIHTQRDYAQQQMMGPAHTRTWLSKASEWMDISIANGIQFLISSYHERTGCLLGPTATLNREVSDRELKLTPPDRPNQPHQLQS
jgi:hypothetical protein